MTTPPRKYLSGFSLTELLVAIGIIALLLAIAVPTVGSFRQKQKVIQCMAQQKQIGAALLVYAADNRGKLPPFIQGNEILSSTGSQNSLARRLVPPLGKYLPDSSVFGDPGALGRIYTRNEEGWYDWTNGQKDRSGYWHVYMSPHSTHNPDRAADGQYGANDTVLAEPYKVTMYCYHATKLSDCAHEKGEVNVLRVDGSVEGFRRGQYQPGRTVLDNFMHRRNR